MIRPPPLQLKFDNTVPLDTLRTPSLPKPKSFVAQLYKASWKNPVIALAGLNGLRYAFTCYNAFGDAVVDKEEGAEHLFSVSLALSAIYVISLFIEIYGIIGVSFQRLRLVRAYLYLTFFTLLLVTLASVLRGVTYFTLGGELILECIGLAIEGRGWQKSSFRGRPWPGSAVPYPEKLAAMQCLYAWKHHSWNHIAAVLLFDFIPIVAHYIFVYTYYKQTIDPMHNACLLNERLSVTPAATRRRADRGTYTMVEMNDRDHGMTTASFQHVSTACGALTARQRRSTQQAPYNRRLTSDHGASGLSSRPADGPCLQTKRTFISRGISRSHRPPPLVPSPSPLGLNFTPGAPTYNRRPSKVYAAFAAPVASSEYDKFV